MSVANKRRGAAFEIDVLKYLRSEGFEAERLRLAGTKDEGDIVLKVGGVVHILELKDDKANDFSGWTREASVEADNYAEARGIVVPHFAVVSKRRRQPVSMSYVVLPLNEYLRQITLPF